MSIDRIATAQQSQYFLQQIQDYQKEGRDLLQIEYIANQSTVAPLVAKLQSLRAQQASLSERYYEKHPAMIEVQNQIAITQDLIDKAIKNVVATLQATLASEESDQASLAAEAKNRNAEELSLRLQRNQYDSLRDAIQGCRSCRSSAALMPASSPCAAASSYPVVPLIWPAKNRPATVLVSSDALRSRGSKKSYSIA